MAQSTAKSELPGRWLAVSQGQNPIRYSFQQLLRLNKAVNYLFGMVSVYSVVSSRIFDNTFFRSL